MEEVAGIEEAVAGYLAVYSGRTAAGYKCIVGKWLKWCGEEGIDPLDPGRTGIEAYRAWMSEKLSMRRSSVNNALSVICGMYRFAYEQGIIDRDPGEHVRRMRTWHKSEGTFLDRRGAALFLAAADSSGDPTVRALCSLLLLCGVRIGEALSLDVGDCDVDGRKVRLDRKGDWSQVVSIPGKVADDLRALVRERSVGPVFRGRKGGRLGYIEARAIVAEVASSTGAEGITPHSLRRTFCTLSRDAGVPDVEIMASGGWSSQSMLDYYDMGSRGAKSRAGDILEEYLQDDD